MYERSTVNDITMEFVEGQPLDELAKLGWKPVFSYAKRRP
jgi:hypothetical protein